MKSQFTISLYPNSFLLHVTLIGAENIHRLTLSGLTTVRIDLEDYDGNKRYAEYSFFNVSDGNDHYRLTVSGYSGTAGTIWKKTFMLGFLSTFTNATVTKIFFKTMLAVWSLNYTVYTQREQWKSTQHLVKLNYF